jgi:hypothetical protein
MRKKVEESEEYGGECTSFLRLSTSCSGAKHGCMWVTVKKHADVCGFTLYESRICAKFLKKVPFS